MRIVFIGAGDIGLPTLGMLANSGEHRVVAVVTQPDKPSGRRMECKPSAIKLMAAARGIPVLQPEKIRAPATLTEIRLLQPEAIVVMAYGQILPKALLEMPRFACLNLHASLLPRHRGASPIQAAILAGDALSGITVIYMAEGLDGGDILLRREIPIGEQETGGSLHDRLAELAPSALAEALSLLAEGKAPRTAQNQAEATYAAKLSREDGAIGWQSPSTEIARRIRAFDPWPTAFTSMSGPSAPLKLKLFAPVALSDESGALGEVLSAADSGLLIASGKGAITVCELQLEGKRRMPAGTFIHGHPIPRGTVLGRAN